MNWPNKDKREELEIKGFIKAFKEVYLNIDLKVVLKREKPDYVVKDTSTNQEYGVELTSVYLNDKSVPDEHIPPLKEELTTVGIPHDSAEVGEYKKRLIGAIISKVSKARKGYDLSLPLILSIHVNEYRAIFIDTKQEWEALVRSNESVFDDMHPFCEIVFWNLANGRVYCVKPESGV